jgi:Zn-dependent peptidase ImmA (M78 family)
MVYFISSAEKFLFSRLLEISDFNGIDKKRASEYRLILKNEIEDKIWSEFNFLGKSKPPFDPSDLFSYYKILSIEELSKDYYQESLLVPVIDGFKILVKKNISNIRMRLNISHELGHTYFYDLGEKVPKRGYNQINRSVWVEEGYAFEIGRMILMPKQSLYKDTRISNNLLNIEKIATDYNVSLDALFRRLLLDFKILNGEFIEGYFIGERFRIIVKHKSNSMDKYLIFKQSLGPENELLRPVYDALFTINSGDREANSEFIFRNRLLHIQAYWRPTIYQDNRIICYLHA